ncbi:MAG: protein phosphatase 2C domain-containing protein, partial [Planctomycetaceae bacterium]|nr:protein phosphatase 2C domain-containing protein [Planctomycetaceae bacterium]
MERLAAIWKHCLEYAALTDVGLRRANNQDSYVVVLAGNQADFERRGHFFMVCDGMGAHAAGELASKMATDIVSLAYRKVLDQSPPEALLSAILDANRQVHAKGQASPDFRGMGTTATTLVLLPAGALVAHVGDSRAYRLRGNRLDQLTFDHSLVWEMRASGQLPSDQTPSYISKNIITRSLGPNATVQIDLEGPFPVQAGDTFLVCCDGLSNTVKDDEIGMILGCLPPSEAVRALIDLGCLRGGPDNITAVVTTVLGPQVQAANAGDSTGGVSANVRPIHPLIWILFGVSMLGSIGLFGLGHIWAALACLVSGFAAAATGLWQRYGGQPHPEADNRHFGRGPYVTIDATPTA